MKTVMTVRLEIRPDIETNLAAQARARGIPLDAYLQDVIEEPRPDQSRPSGKPARSPSDARRLGGDGQRSPSLALIRF